MKVTTLKKLKSAVVCGVVATLFFTTMNAQAQVEVEITPEHLKFLMQTLTQARANFKTKLVVPPQKKEPMEIAPSDVMQTVKYQAPGGNYGAYLSLPFKDGKKHPAIVWMTGGDSNSVGDVWSERSPDNDQSAVQFERAGVVMMYPSLRGGNDNPGRKEGFLGEVDDILAATDFLAKQPGVDADRIYLGGHSTGGTLALLVAASSNRFRGVFAFGPVASVYSYGLDSEYLPFDTSDQREMEIRSPLFWSRYIETPTYVIEGEEGNIESLRILQKLYREKDTANPNLHFLEVAGANHFNVLAPVNTLLARFIMEQSKTPGTDTTITQSALDNALASRKR